MENLSFHEVEKTVDTVATVDDRWLKRRVHALAAADVNGNNGCNGVFSHGFPAQEHVGSAGKPVRVTGKRE